MEIPKIGYFATYLFLCIMEKEELKNIMNVWETRNKIVQPTDSKAYIQFVDQIANLFSAGSFYYFVMNFVTLKMELIHEGTKTVLGIENNEFNFEKLYEIMHPDDRDKIPVKENIAIDFFYNHVSFEDIYDYKVVYLMRLKHKDGTYKTILHQSKTMVVSEDGKVQQTLVVHTDVTYLNIPFDHKVSFISSIKPSFYALDTEPKFKALEKNYAELLTTREKEIIKKLSEGNNFNEIARLLHLSPHTINTHKKNILKKTDCKNTTELVANCIREGVI